ncbi:hypothetical protein ASPZODRAFT_127584 [Penicilliopsis zonata CBS 506.65]|uniref:Uncharacterized protein n=1 Tax=Penicilliopsis zonata CBS 506.65 TaxID=1073090 RepID=A0A1L9SWC7_9EURO|nr:hypothetical protein ASPZODRAFT_127584 [Penicilliopsis zonata CBS 506.65]OJJ51502.1 hypothetical protein ASPZODRAFT_127584 [Penicilliopsis zonata CBS 506.65]
MAPVRRSGRLSNVRTKYSEDPFLDAGISGGESDSAYLSASETKKQKGKKKALQVDSSSDNDFVAVERDDDDEYNSPDEVSDEGDAPGSDSDATDDDDNDDMIENGGKPSISTSRYHKKRNPDRAIVLAGTDTHSRGILNPMEHAAKPIHLRVTFGTDQRDLLAIVYSRDRWFRGIDSGFPSRASLNEAKSLPDYGYGLTFGLGREEWKTDSTRAWDWYYQDLDNGRPSKRQRLETIAEGEARQAYLPPPKAQKHTVIIGPADEQRVFRLGQHESLNFGDAWGARQPQAKKSGPRVESKSRKSSSKVGGTGSTPVAERKIREGWILNLGSKVQCSAWVPNQNGLTQFLAVVTPVSREQRINHSTTSESKAAPAFSPSLPDPAALQIWAFKAKDDGSLTKTIDMNFEPRLRLTLCTDWGDVRRIAWCPMAREPREEDDEDVSKNVGLLAGIWGDGSVRVLDIKVSRDPRGSEFYKVASPMFTAKPPSTVCTCVAWLSPSDIAVGCANGFVAVWSIAASQKSTSHPAPYVYRQFHSTYILNIAPAYPTHPHLLGTTSMDGDTCLTSILDHQVDMVQTTRMRIGSSHISYSPFLQSFFSSDENDFARLLAMRRFFTTSAVARLPSTISAMAPCSSWHPSALLGCTGGSVMATNPLRRLLHPKEKQWQQTWFAHEWVPGHEGDDDSGVSRFQDGFKADNISLLRNTLGERKLINGTSVVTIFEEGTHITSLAWNPSQICAGWACAGMGCGLIRVEDLAI